MPALVFQNLGFDLGPRKLVVFRTDRNDLPHLTLSWNNASGEVDLHFTPAHPKDANDRDSIINIPQTVLADYFFEIGEQFTALVAPRIFKLFFPVRAEWLRRNYFKVLQPRGDSFEEWLIRASPKLRGKYRTDIRHLREFPRHWLRQPTTEFRGLLRVSCCLLKSYLEVPCCLRETECQVRYLVREAIEPFRRRAALV